MGGSALSTEDSEDERDGRLSNPSEAEDTAEVELRRPRGGEGGGRASKVSDVVKSGAEVELRRTRTVRDSAVTGSGSVTRELSFKAGFAKACRDRA